MIVAEVCRFSLDWAQTEYLNMILLTSYSDQVRFEELIHASAG